MSASKLKTVFQSYKRPENSKKLRVILAGLLGIGTIGGLGVGAYHMVSDSNRSMAEMVSSQRPSAPIESRPIESKPASSGFSGMVGSLFHSNGKKTAHKKKKKAKTFAEKRKASKKRFAKKGKKRHHKFAKNHKKGKKKAKFAKHSKKHKQKKTLAQK